MKKITLSFVLLIFSLGYSQNAPITFEAGGFGADWTWTTFENDTNPQPVVLGNPDMMGINSSATIAKFVALDAGNPWAGCETLHGAGIGTFTLTAANCIVKIMVWKTVISDVGIKFATSTGGSTGEIKVANTLTNQWEELTFNFSGKIGEPTSTNIDQIIIFPDFNFNRTTDNVVYFDNITFSSGAVVVNDPVTAAPTPTRPAENVISMFSNAYTNVTVDTWRTDWSAATLENVQVVGNDTKKYTSLNFVGVETVGPNLIDASEMLFFHVDYWTPNMTAFRVKLVDFGTDANFGGGDDTETELTFTPALAGWNSLEIPMSDFTNLLGREHIAQLIFSGNPAGSGTVYVDNVYFHNEAVIVNPTEPTVAAPTPTRPAQNVISMFSNAYTNVTVDTWRTDWSVATLEEVQIAGNDNKKYTNLNFVGVETVGANLIDASEMLFFHVDYWTPNMTTFRVKLVDFGADASFAGGDDTETELTFTPTLAGWNALEIPMSDFTNLLGREHIAQLIFSGNPAGAGTVWVDNVYFHNTPSGDPNTPMTAAPTPTLPAENVISMFSNPYTNVPVNTWRTDWSAAQLQDVQIEGNDTKKYTSLDFVGIETVGANLIDASAMSFFHVDYWTPNMTVFRVKLVDFGANGTFQGGDDTEAELVFTPTLSGWNSLHIPLSDFTTLLNKDNIAQLIFSGTPAGAGIVFVDNVYFSNVALGVNNLDLAKVAMYPNPASNQVTIESTSVIQNISFYNVLGQEVVSKQPNTAATTVDISALQNGIYIVKATVEGKVVTSKVVKK